MSLEAIDLKGNLFCQLILFQLIQTPQYCSLDLPLVATFRVCPSASPRSSAGFSPANPELPAPQPCPFLVFGRIYS